LDKKNKSEQRQTLGEEQRADATVPATVGPEKRLPRMVRRPNARFSAAVKRTFLQYIAQGYCVEASCRAAGVSSCTIYAHKAKDPEFAAAYAEAQAANIGVVDDEIRRRAIEGWLEPVYQGGELVGHVRKYSDPLLTLLAKSRDARYREKTALEVSGPGGSPVQLLASRIVAFARHEREAMADYLRAVVLGEDLPAIEPGLLQALAESLPGAVVAAQYSTVPDNVLEALAAGSGVHDDGVDHV
jgi:hypothetical protein